MSGLPPGADSVSSAGPLPSTTYGTGSIATSATSATDANIDRSRTTVRRCRPPCAGTGAGGGGPGGTPSNGEAPYGAEPSGEAPYGAEPSGEAPYGEEPSGGAPYGEPGCGGGSCGVGVGAPSGSDTNPPPLLGRHFGPARAASVRADV